MTIGLFKNGEFVTLVTLLLPGGKYLVERCWGVDEFGKGMNITAIVNKEKPFGDAWIPITGHDHTWICRMQSWRGETLFVKEAVEL